ncbi:MAG: DUF2585 family protein [Hyphomicrobiaceae bacterium]
MKTARPATGDENAAAIGAAALVAVAAILAVQAVTLKLYGQPLTCTCGHISLWYANPSGPETSQQISDWYTFSHVIHGIGFYALLWWFFPRMPLGWRLALAVGLEGGWELFENTPFIIDRYRQSALAQGYVGDSVLNSLCDTLAAIGGFFLARLLPVRGSVAFVVATELFCGYMIRDNLTLNIIQLLRPSAAISRWQTGK